MSKTIDRDYGDTKYMIPCPDCETIIEYDPDPEIQISLDTGQFELGGNEDEIGMECPNCDLEFPVTFHYDAYMDFNTTKAVVSKFE